MELDCSAPMEELPSTEPRVGARVWCLLFVLFVLLGPENTWEDPQLASPDRPDASGCAGVVVVGTVLGRVVAGVGRTVGSE